MSKKSYISNIYKPKPEEQIFKSDIPYEYFPVIKIGLIFSMPLLRLLQKINIKFHPSILSFGNLFSCITAGIFFSQNLLLFGALFFFIALIFDLLDGPYARLTNQYTSFVKWFDPICDRIGKLVCFIGLWYGIYYTSGQGWTGIFWIGFYYTLELYATFFLQDRFSNPMIPFSVWEVSFIIFVVAPSFNIVELLLPVGVVLLICLYTYRTSDKIRKYLTKEKSINDKMG